MTSQQRIPSDEYVWSTEFLDVASNFLGFLHALSNESSSRFRIFFLIIWWCRSCTCVLVKIMPCAIVDRLVGCSLYFCYGHVGPESTRPTCQYRDLACWGLVALAFASRPDGHEFLSHHHLHAHMLTWQSFLVDLGTVRTFSCSMMHVANNGKNEFS